MAKRRSFLVNVALVVGTGTTFTAALAASALLHVGTAPARRIVATQVTAVLSKTFDGKLTIDHLDRVGWRGISASAHVQDAQGREIVRATGIHATASLVGIGASVVSALTRKTVMHIPISDITVQNAEVLMVPDGDGSGVPSIARAFLPRPTPTDARTTSSPGPTVDVNLPKIVIDHAWVHGELPGIAHLDVDLANVQGSVRTTNDETTVDVSSADFVARSLVPGVVRGHAEAHGAFPSAKDGAIRATAQVDADVAGLAVHAHATIDGSDLVAAVDVPPFEADALRVIFPASPLVERGEVHVAVKGTLPNLGFAGSVKAGAGDAAVDGTLAIGAGVRAKGHVVATNIDLRAFATDAPASKVDVEGTGALAVDSEGALTGTFEAQTKTGVVAGERVPAVEVRGTVAGANVQGAATVHEPGVPTSVTFNLRAIGGPGAVRPATVVDFTTRSRVFTVSAISRLGINVPIRGKGVVTTRGRVDLTAGTLDAHATLAATEVDAPYVHAAVANVRAHVHGPFRALAIDADVTATDVVQGPMHFAGLTVKTRGTLDDMRVEARLAGSETAPNVEVLTNVGFRAGGVVVLRNALFMVERDEVVVRGKVDAIRATATSIDLKNVVVDGLGETLFANVHFDPSDLAIDAHSERIELPRVAVLLGAREDLTAGVASFETFAGVHAKIPYGEMTLEATNVRAFGQAPIHAIVNAVIDASKVKGTADVQMDTIGIAHVDSNVDFDGSALKLATWRAASGTLSVDARADIARLVQLLPKDFLPVASVTGELSVKGSIVRQGDTIPDLRLSASTKKLAVLGRATEVKRADGTIEREDAGFRSRDIDIDARLNVDGESGFSELSATLRDHHGILVFADAKTDVPVTTLLNDPSQGRGLVEKLHVSSHIEIPRRRLDVMPEVVGVLPIVGEASASVDLAGTLSAPRADVSLRGFELRPAGDAATRSHRGAPLDVDARATYDGNVGNARVMVARRGRTVFDAYAIATAPLAGIEEGLRDPEVTIPWDASMRAQFDRFALADVSSLAGERISGAMSGDVAVDNLHSKPKLDVRLTFDKVAVGEVEVPKAALSLLVDQQNARGAVRLEQTDGYASATLAAPIHWASLTPALDTSRPLDLTYDVSRLRLAALAPFVRTVLGSLDGRVDGKGSITIEPGTGGGKMNGTLAVSEAKFLIMAVGDELHNVKATAHVDPWGTVRVDNVEAFGVTGRLTANASAKLKGFSVESAVAQLRIAEREPLPLSLHGVPLGEAWGEINIKAEQSTAKDGYTVDLSLPRLHFDLPQVVGRTIQDIASDATVRMGTNTPDGFVLLRPEKPWQTKETSGDGDKVPPTRLRITARLGNDVLVSRGTSIRVNLTGAPVIDYDGATRMSGEIIANQGYLEIQGKRFQVERAVVTFTGSEPSNPTVVATAYYDAPDRTRVFADFVGPVKTGKLTLHSDPPHTNDEIVAILLFGSADGALGAAASSRRAGASETNTAVAVGGGFVAEGLNQALSGISPYEITARIATNESNNPRPELAVQISKTVSARVGYNLGLPAPGQNPDRTMLMLDWRFRRRWSMLTTVGDRGSSILDFIWHLRY